MREQKNDVVFRILPLVQVKEDGSPIDLDQIRAVCSEQMRDGPPEDRVLAWLVITGVFPLTPDTWFDTRAHLVAEYKAFIEDFGVSGFEERYFSSATNGITYGVPREEIMTRIHVDVVRTGHHITEFPYPDVRESTDEDDVLGPYHEHMRRIERILYIFAMCNRSLSYVQGFNEIVAVLYYVFASGALFFNFNWLEIEAMVFYMFQRMFAVTTLSELFTTQDKSSLIYNKMREFMALLERHLPEVAEMVTKLDIHPLQFCFRKLNLLFAQDHAIPGLIVLWDALFARFPDIVEFESYIMLGNVRMVSALLDPRDYVQTMTALQKLRVCDSKMLLRYALEYWKVDHPEI